MKAGTEAIVYSENESFTYIIESVRVVDRSDVSVMLPTQEAMLTMITGANWDPARGAYTRRVVATGRLVQQ